MFHFLLLKIKFYGVLIYTHADRHISARKPDIVYNDKNAKVAWVIDIAVPAQHHVKDKQIKKDLSFYV